MANGLALLFVLVAAGSEITVVPSGATAVDLAPTLRLLGEPALESWVSAGRIYRFLYLPPFPSQRVFSVRVQDVGNGPELLAQAVSRETPARVRVQRRLTRDEWQGLSDMRDDGFWKFLPDPYPQPVFDGAVWVLEGSSGGERLRLVQHVPKRSPFTALCRRMLRLSRIRLLETEHSLEMP